MIFIKEPVKTGSSLGSSLIFQNVESHSYERTALITGGVYFAFVHDNQREAISFFDNRPTLQITEPCHNDCTISHNNLWMRNPNRKCIHEAHRTSW